MRVRFVVIKYLCTGYICTGSVLWGGTGYYLVVMWYESSTPDFVVVKQQSLSKIIFSYFLKNGSEQRELPTQLHRDKGVNTPRFGHKVLIMKQN